MKDTKKPVGKKFKVLKVDCHSLSPQKELLALLKSRLKTNTSLQMESAKIEFKVI